MRKSVRLAMKFRHGIPVNEQSCVGDVLELRDRDKL
jgi:hypothetical protein